MTRLIAIYTALRRLHRLHLISVIGWDMRTCYILIGTHSTVTMWSDGRWHILKIEFMNTRLQFCDWYPYHHICKICSGSRWNKTFSFNLGIIIGIFYHRICSLSWTWPKAETFWLNSEKKFIIYRAALMLWIKVQSQARWMRNWPKIHVYDNWFE